MIHVTRKFKIFSSLAWSGLILLCSCGTYSHRQAKDQSAVQSAQLAILTNQLGSAQKAGQLAYAAGAALEKISNAPPAAQLARTLNERVQLILGAPELKDAVALRQMVENLLDESEANHKKGAHELAQRDFQIVQLQRQAGILEEKLSRTEQRRDQNYIQAAAAADKWQKLMGWIHRAMWVAGIFVVSLVGINIAALAYPPLLPVASIFNHLTGGLFGFFFGLLGRILPETLHHARVVPQEDHQALQSEHQVSETTLAHLVGAIEKIKLNKPEIYRALRPELLEATSVETSRPKINEVQLALGHA